MQLDTILLLIEGSLPARLVATTPLVYPLVSAVHLMGIALLVGSIVVVDLRLLGLLGPQFDAALPSLVRVALVGFAVAATTGALLASVRIADYADNPAFRAKLLILLAAGLNARLLRVLSNAGSWLRMVAQTRGRIAAALSLSLWTMAVMAGRWIAFV
jgi:hypothetical protein